MANRQTIPIRHHATIKMHLCARNFEQARNVKQNPPVLDKAHRDASTEPQPLIKMGQMMETVISTVSFEHEKLKSEIVKKQTAKPDSVSHKGSYMVFLLIFLIFLADLFFSYF